MLADNRVLMRAINNITYNKLLEMENSPRSSTIIVEPSRQGADTLAVIIDEKPVYIHSKYNPQKEVDSFIEQLENITDVKHLFIIGIGLGYHLEKLVEKYPRLKITIYEPNVEILSSYLSKHLLNKNIVSIFTDLTEINNIDAFVKDFTEVTHTIIWPSYLRIYEAEIKKMQENLVEILKGARKSLATNVAFQHRWIANSLLNFPKVLETPNIITEKYKQQFKGKPVIIVAAGPSLNEEIEVLRTIKEEGSAYIFAVGSGVNVLLHHGIIPHAVFSYDPTIVNQKVLQRVKNENLESVPLVFGSSIGFETLIDYPSKMVHMITSADKFSTKVLNVPNEQVIEDSPSIAVMTLQVVKKLEMEPIILAGQNLGYLNNVVYGDGVVTSREKNELTDDEIAKRELTKDVNGNDMYTNMGYLDMKRGLEVVIKRYNYGTVINTTKKGAHIEGARFQELSSLKEQMLTQKNIIIEDWVIEELEYTDGIEGFHAMYENYKKMMPNIDKSVKIANDIQSDYEAGIYSKINAQIKEFYKHFRKVVESDSHQAITQPAIKVQNQRFADRYKEVDFEKQPRKKAEKFIEITYAYLGSIYETTKALYPIMQKVQYDLHELQEVD